MNWLETEKVYDFGWLKSGGKGSLMRKILSSMMQISIYALAGGLYVSASSWQDAPTAPPQHLI